MLDQHSLEFVFSPFTYPFSWLAVVTNRASMQDLIDEAEKGDHELSVLHPTAGQNSDFELEGRRDP